VIDLVNLDMASLKEYKLFMAENIFKITKGVRL
jgi:hypothetical protein